MEPGQDANYVYDLLRVEMPQNQPHPQLPGISSVSLASTSDALFAPAHYGGLVVEYNPVILRFDAPFYSETAHLISQGPNQKPTHEGFLRNDIDFTMGKFDVAASAGGIVRIFDPCDGAADQDACTLGLEKNNDFGKFVTIDHMVSGLNPSDRIFTVYAHLDSVVSSLRDGDYVQAGQLLGVQGRTGFATGNHIHWGIFSGDPSIDPLTLPRDERETAWTPVGVREGFPLIMGVSGESAARKFTTNEDISSLVCPDARNPQSYGCRYVFSMLERTSDENFSGFIDEGESYLFSLFASNSTLLSGNLTWPGSELALDIFNPLGDLSAPCPRGMA